MPFKLNHNGEFLKVLGNSIHYGKILLIILESVRKVVYVMVSSDNSLALVTMETVLNWIQLF